RPPGPAAAERAPAGGVPGPQEAGRGGGRGGPGRENPPGRENHLGEDDPRPAVAGTPEIIRLPPGWKEAFLNEGFTDPHNLSIIHCQDDHCYPPHSGAAHQKWSVPAKVPCPFVAPWVEQFRQLPGLRIVSGNIWSLVAVTVQTRKGQVAQPCWTD